MTFKWLPSDVQILNYKFDLPIIGGAIKAKVDELIAPTREIKRSNFGIAAAKETEIWKENVIRALFW